MRILIFAIALALATVIVACGSGAPLRIGADDAAGHASAGTAGAHPGDAGTSGAAGTSGEAGMGDAGAGAAGTTDALNPTADASPKADAGAPDRDASTGTAGTGSAGAPPDASGNEAGGGAGLDAAPGLPDAIFSSDASATLSDGRCVAGAFKHNNNVCQCQPEVPVVCGAACTDLMNDDDNCGACGNACGFTSTCQRGKCGPAPVNIVPPIPGCNSINLVVGAGNVFWTDQGHNKVSSIPVAGGTIAPIAVGAASPTLIALNGSTVYWLEEGTRTIRRAALNGTPLTVVTSPTDIAGFTVSEDGTAVFYSTGTTILKVAVTGGLSVDVVHEEGLGTPHALVQQGSLLAYPTGLNGDVDVATLAPAQLARCGRPDPETGEVIHFACTRVARSQGSLFLDAILMRGNRVFWADGSNFKAADVLTGLAVNDNVAQTSTGNSIGGFAATATTVYFSDDGGITQNNGFILKSPLVKDSIGLRIARRQVSPRSLAVDATRVYWATDCTINATGL